MALSADEASEDQVVAAHADEVAENGQIAVAAETSELWEHCKKDVVSQMEMDEDLLVLVCRQRHFLQTTRDVTVEEVDNNFATLPALSLSVKKYVFIYSSVVPFIQRRWTAI